MYYIDVCRQYCIHAGTGHYMSDEGPKSLDLDFRGNWPEVGGKPLQIALL